jgi:polyphenol oxidase
MKLIRSNLITLYPNITACFTTQDGGVSSPPYQSLNLAFHVEDNPKDVIQNHDILASKLLYNRHNLVHMKQIHSDTIIKIDESYNFDTPPICDAMITNITNIPLMVMSADCTPILLYDYIHDAIGVVHAGRAGALNGILPKTIQRMGEYYETKTKNILVVLGPSIHGCCYEINDSIAHAVEEKGYINALVRKDKKIFLEVNTILLQQLDFLGIPYTNIEVVNHCTACQSDTYFSYRAHAKHTGRIAGVICLR